MLIKINIFNNNINNIKKRLIKSFDDFILFEILKINKLLYNVIINTINIKIKFSYSLL